MPRTAWTPHYSLTVGGQDITATAAPYLLALEITDALEADADDLTLRLDWRGRVIALPRRGAEIRVAIGWREIGLVDMPGFVVDEVSRGNDGSGLVLEIRGRAADLRGPLRAPKSRSLDPGTLGALLDTLAGDNGLAAVVDPDLAAIPLAHIDQTTESDIHLATRLVQAAGGRVKVADGKLVAAVPGSGKAAGSGASLGGVALAERDVLSWRITSQDRAAAKTASAPRHDLAQAGTVWEVTEGDGDGPPVEVRWTEPAAGLAQARSKATAEAAGRGGETLTLTTEGKPTLTAGAMITLEGGWGEDDGSRWSLKRVMHRLGADGFRTEVEAEAPTPKTTAQPATGAGRADDPAPEPEWRPDLEYQLPEAGQ